MYLEIDDVEFDKDDDLVDTYVSGRVRLSRKKIIAFLKKFTDWEYGQFDPVKYWRRDFIVNNGYGIDFSIGNLDKDDESIAARELIDEAKYQSDIDRYCPTCKDKLEQEDSQTFYCRDCDQLFDKSVLPKGHNYDYWLAKIIKQHTKPHTIVHFYCMFTFAADTDEYDNYAKISDYEKMLGKYNPRSQKWEIVKYDPKDTFKGVMKRIFKQL